MAGFLQPWGHSYAKKSGELIQPLYAAQPLEEREGSDMQTKN
jgi:hypothetical protein